MSNLEYLYIGKGGSIDIGGTLAFGDGTNDVLYLEKYAVLHVNDLTGVEVIEAGKGVAIFSNTQFDFDDVIGNWEGIALFHNADINAGSGSVYGNEWDVYSGLTGDLTLGGLEDGFDFDVDKLVNGEWIDLNLNNGVLEGLENATIRVGVDGAFVSRSDRKDYDITLA